MAGLDCGKNREPNFVASQGNGDSFIEAATDTFNKMKKTFRSHWREVVAFTNRDCPKDCPKKKVVGPHVSVVQFDADYDKETGEWSIYIVIKIEATVTCS